MAQKRADGAAELDTKSADAPDACLLSDDEGDLAGGASDDARLLEEKNQFLRDAAPATPPMGGAPLAPTAAPGSPVFQAGAQQ